MPLSANDLRDAFQGMDLTVETDGKHFVHSTPGRYAENISTIVTVDDDLGGATIVATLSDEIPAEKRPAVYELLNLAHGQSLWHFRYHLDDEGRLMTIAKVGLWGRSFNPTQFGDIFFTVLVTTDRLAPCLKAIVEGNRSGQEAFELFFLKK